MKLHVEAIGTRPLLMHNVQLASPMNRYAQMIRDISSKRSKTDEDRVAIAEIEFKGGLYWDEVHGPYIPGTMIFANLTEGAKVTRSGKKIERGVDVVELVNPLIYDGPRDMDKLWRDSDFVDMRSVRVTTSRVDRTRPIFRQWSVEYDLLFDPEIVSLDDITRIIRDAGTLSGFGDYRKLYGRYRAIVSPVDD